MFLSFRLGVLDDGIHYWLTGEKEFRDRFGGMMGYSTGESQAASCLQNLAILRPWPWDISRYRSRNITSAQRAGDHRIDSSTGKT